MQESSGQKRSALIVLLLMLVLIVLFFVQLLGFVPSDEQDKGWSRLPISIRAGSQADYSRDADRLSVQPISNNIFEQIIQDLQGAGSLDERMATLQVSLSMPVPTMTLNPQMPTSTISPLLTITSSSVFGTTTPQATASLSVTNTVPVSTPTSTPVSVAASPTQQVPGSVPNPTKKPKPTQRPMPTQRIYPTKKP